MKISRLVLSLTSAVILTSTCVAAVDLTQIDRTIKKEPHYRHKPKYGLAVFGLEAKTRIWMVRDGDVLYVDRNGNGDLTEKGEQVKGERDKDQVQFDIGKVAGEIVATDGKTGKCEMFVIAWDKTNQWAIACRLPGSKSPWGGNVSWFVGNYNAFHGFVDQREAAPIFHFSGPLTMDLVRKPGFVLAGGKKTDLISQIGTPGLGVGTFATYMVHSKHIKESLGGKGVLAKIQWASTDTQGKAATMRISLNRLACGAVFWNTVEIPEEAARIGKVKITLSLPRSEKMKIPAVAAATFEVSVVNPEATKEKVQAKKKQ